MYNAVGLMHQLKLLKSWEVSYDYHSIYAGGPDGRVRIRGIPRYCGGVFIRARKLDSGVINNVVNSCFKESGYSQCFLVDPDVVPVDAVELVPGKLYVIDNSKGKFIKRRMKA